MEADDRAPKFIHNKGVRGEYWCWRKDMSEKSFLSVDMENVKDGIIYNLGYREIFLRLTNLINRYIGIMRRLRKLSRLVV